MLAGTDQRLFLVALASRAVVLLFSNLFSWTVGEYDTSSSIDLEHLLGGTEACRARCWGVGPLAHWDSVYFLRIAQAGTYEFEQFHAFFPFLPFAIRVLSSAAGVLGSRCSMMWMGWLLTSLCFAASVVVFHRLSVAVIGHISHPPPKTSTTAAAAAADLRRRADVATALFMLNPATIFFSAVYTESPFAFFSLAGLLAWFRRRYLLAWTLFLICGFVRSNAFLFAGFFFWDALSILCMGHAKTQSRWVFRAVLLVVLGLCLLLPFLLFQIYGHALYCGRWDSSSFAVAESLPPRPYCKSLWSMYSFIQSQYWNVGFLKYYEVKQMPNFLLASPVICLSLSAIYRKLTAKAGSASKQISMGSVSDSDNRRTGVSGSSLPSTFAAGTCQFLQRRLLWDRTNVFYWYWLILVVTALTVMHVQVTTRFVASVPPLYWSLAACRRRIRWIFGYCLLYTWLGTLMFSNFYPWT